MLLHQSLYDGANRHPEHPAFHWVERDKTLTYAQAVEEVEALAGALHSLGASKGDRITIFAHNGMDYLLSMLATWRIGAISSLVNVKFADHLEEYLADHTPGLVIYTHDKVDDVKRAAEIVGSVKRLICMDGSQEGAESLPELLKARLPAPADPRDEDAIAHLSYTSGTTGKPKGACLAHEFTYTACACIAERLRIRSDEISFGPTALSSSYQLVGNIMPSLIVGATCTVMKDWAPETGFEALKETKANVFIGNPTFLTDVLEQSRLQGGAPEFLRLGLSGGGPVPLALKTAWRDELKLPLVESYGQSEIGGFFGLGTPDLVFDDTIGAVGRPLPDKEVRILDANDEELPLGQVGEICMRGRFMKGYWDRPEQTTDTLRNGWLHSGDVGSMSASGHLTMRGRTKELLQVDGRTWFPRDVEEELIKLDGIREAAVIGLNAEDGGHDPVAFFTGTQMMSEDEMKAAVENSLPYDLSSLTIRWIESFPMTPTGKIAKAELKDNAAKEAASV
ncbi:class I adenylate-forming enzyme family protein [Hoeflea sp.]|uniref:class I adenylate-forming enzyme family protein n=1 Tax=Hoeflea sp. TaxID=1940281 RepID=UPI003B012BB9